MFTLAEKAIYAFPDRVAGVVVTRHADPLAVEEGLFRGLADHDAEALDAHLVSDDPAILYPALAKLIPAARGAFGLAPFDGVTGSGLTNEEVLGLLTDFNDWRDEKKGNAGDGLNTSPPTATLPGPSATTTTPGSSANTGTASGSSPSGPSPSGAA